MSKALDAQERIAALLAAEAATFYLPADPETNQNAGTLVPVVTQRVGDIEKTVDETLAAIGIGVIIMLPLWAFVGRANRVSMQLKFAIAITENPTVNETGFAAETITEKAIGLLHWKPNSTAVSPNNDATRFVVDPNAVKQLTPPPKNRAVLTYILSLNTIINLP